MSCSASFLASGVAEWPWTSQCGRTLTPGPKLAWMSQSRTVTHTRIGMLASSSTAASLSMSRKSSSIIRGSSNSMAPHSPAMTHGMFGDLPYPYTSTSHVPRPQFVKMEPRSCTFFALGAIWMAAPLVPQKKQLRTFRLVPLHTLTPTPSTLSRKPLSIILLPALASSSRLMHLRLGVLDAELTSQSSIHSRALVSSLANAAPEPKPTAHGKVSLDRRTSALSMVSTAPSSIMSCSAEEMPSTTSSRLRPSWPVICRDFRMVKFGQRLTPVRSNWDTRWRPARSLITLPGTTASTASMILPNLLGSGSVRGSVPAGGAGATGAPLWPGCCAAPALPVWEPLASSFGAAAPTPAGSGGGGSSSASLATKARSFSRSASSSIHSKSMPSCVNRGALQLGQT
mmetsp:Transcript_23174/g.72719  ORF Transcript_23174/g.72719 Transcript_23174/m.72719 type:complete len:399 (-) Transcript_23174:735-1931(-)